MAEKNKIDQHINAWIEGNELAFQFIFNYYYPRLLAASSKPIKNQKDAEELVMDSLLKIWQNKHRIKDLNKNLGDYLFGILRQEIAGLSRKKVLIMEDLEQVPLQELGIIDHPELSIKDLQFRYQSALHKLTPKQREIFLMSRDQEMTQQQIADKTAISINTVNNHISSSLKIIRKELQDYPDAIVIAFITTQVVIHHL